MKKSLLYIVVILIMTGCNPEPKQVTASLPATDLKIISEDSKEDIMIVEHTKTGCQYMIMSIYSRGVAIQPLLNTDGTPYCKKPKTEE